MNTKDRKPVDINGQFRDRKGETWEDRWNVEGQPTRNPLSFSATTGEAGHFPSDNSNEEGPPWYPLGDNNRTGP